MSTENEFVLAENISVLAESTNKAITILAKAILELGDHTPAGLTMRMRHAVQAIAEEKAEGAKA